MPIFNRRHFLPQAFQSLREQTYRNWNLVIVDDGSCDQPLEVLNILSGQLTQRITYVKRPNGGPGVARATGLKLLTNEEFIAFFDSDDYWLPGYLEKALYQLKNIPELDWIFCPCRRVDYRSGATILDSTLFDDESNEPLLFLSLPQKNKGETFVFSDNHALALMQLRQPIHAGFQNSVIRARLTIDIPIPKYRIGEDRHFLVAAILKGYTIGYLKEVGVIYYVHGNNLSATNRESDNMEKMIAVQEELCRGVFDLKKLTKDKEILREVDRQIANIKFWLIAYNYYWRNGQVWKAILTMTGVTLRHPMNFRYLKTLLFSVIRGPLAAFTKKQKTEC